MNQELENRLVRLENCCSDYRTQIMELEERLRRTMMNLEERLRKTNEILEERLHRSRAPSEEKSEILEDRLHRSRAPAEEKSEMENRKVVLKPVPEYKTGGPETDSDPRMRFFKDQSEAYQNGHDSMDYLNLNEHNRYYYRRTRDEYLTPLDKLEPLGKFKKLVVPSNQHGVRPMLPYYMYTIFFAKKQLKCDDGDELYYTDEPPLEESIPLSIHDFKLQTTEPSPTRRGLGGRKNKTRKNKILHKR